MLKCHNKIEIEHGSFDSSYMRLCPVQVEKDGVFVMSTEVKKFDTKEALAGMSCKDFSFQNMISVGAFDKLKTTFMSSDSDMNIADQFEGIEKKLAAHVSQS